MSVVWLDTERKIEFMDSLRTETVSLVFCLVVLFCFASFLCFQN